MVTGLQQNLTLGDAQAIAREVPGVATLAPVVQGSTQIKYGNRNARTTVLGTAPTYRGSATSSSTGDARSPRGRSTAWRASP